MNQPPRPVVARAVTPQPPQPPRAQQPAQPAQPAPHQQQPGVDIRTLAAELAAIRNILRSQSDMATRKAHRSQSAGCLLIFVGFLHFMAGMNTGRDPLVTAGLLAIAIGVALITR